MTRTVFLFIQTNMQALETNAFIISHLRIASIPYLVRFPKSSCLDAENGDSAGNNSMTGTCPTSYTHDRHSRQLDQDYVELHITLIELSISLSAIRMPFSGTLYICS